MAIVSKVDESQLVRVPVVIAGDYVADEQVAALNEPAVKRKRGRPPRGQAKTPPPAKKIKLKEKENFDEEDVCFICFDGGSLVLCDRRGCPKAYHPACIKRDEAFFQSKAKWNCGWHICSKCEKTSHYMCYTCTFSLCKACTKDADYVSVRGDKGFCSICFKTIMLVENKDTGNKDTPKVDFDDKLSWEYLFKIYWVVLKQKLSLTLPELMQARSPWKEPAVTKIYRGQSQSAGLHYNYNNGKVPIQNQPPKIVEIPKSEEMKTVEPLKIPNGHSTSGDKRNTDKGTSSTGSVEIRAPQLSNLDEYAAVDVHNINLIYLRRDLVANLFEDSNEKFHSKVVESIVRIKVLGINEKKDVHRLVKVVGTNKVTPSYKIGNRSLDVTLKVLNLGNQEDVSVDVISNNQDFSEEECRDLRQNIICGHLERWTVGEIRAKAMSLQAAKFKDWVEVEIMRFNQLRDQASEQGQTKELRDCVERLQLLKSPEERRRRLCEAPEIHSDPRMHPNYGPEEDAGDSNVNKEDAGDSNVKKDAGDSNAKKEDKEEISRKIQTQCDNKDKSQSNNTSELQQANNAATCTAGSGTTVITSETSTTPLSTGSTPPGNESEAEKLWHYRDLHGQTQGPFSMLQLQKWSTSGYFPPDMRIWASRQDDSVLLTDALDGQLLYNISVQFKEGGCENVNSSKKDTSSKTEDLNSTPSNNEQIQIRTTAEKYNEQIQIRSLVGAATSSDGAHLTVTQTEKPQEVEKMKVDDLNQEQWNLSTKVETSSVQAFPSQPSGQSWRPLPLNFFPNNFESGGRNADVEIPDLDIPVPSTSSGGGWKDEKNNNNNSEYVKESVAVDLPILTLKMNNEDQHNNKQAQDKHDHNQSMNFTDQDSDPGWGENYFTNAMNDDTELDDSHMSSLSSKIDLLFHSPRSHPASSSWQMGFTERIEFNTLAEESVSDLLAEVDAMESQGGLPSPTSVMKCSIDMMHGPKHDYFSNMEEEFSPTLDQVKTEALTLTDDVHNVHKLPPPPPPPLLSTTHFDTFDTPLEVSRKSRSSKSNKSSSSSTRWDSVQPPHQHPNDNGSHIQFHAPFSQDLVDPVETHRSKNESMENDWLKMNHSSERAKPDGRSNNCHRNIPSPLHVPRKSSHEQADGSGWDHMPGNLTSAGLLGKSPQVISPNYAGISSGISPGSRGRDSQRKHSSGDRLTSPRDRVSHSRDSSRGSKSSWSRQSSNSVGGGSGGGYTSSRHPARGQRVCKFYESGHCKKGAMCDYFHP
jgi:hypothetical protein